MITPRAPENAEVLAERDRIVALLERLAGTSSNGQARGAYLYAAEEVQRGGLEVPPEEWK
jgi:hypothetical protein